MAGQTVETIEKTEAMLLREALRIVLIGAIGKPRTLARRAGIPMAEARRIWQLAKLPE